VFLANDDVPVGEPVQDLHAALPSLVPEPVPANSDDIYLKFLKIVSKDLIKRLAVL
jgi:hypothetical protein